MKWKIFPLWQCHCIDVTLKATKLQASNCRCVVLGSAPKGYLLNSGPYDEAGFERLSPVLCWGNVAAMNFTVDSVSMT